jgi:tripartite-type tricarboxylate transporter receptor subunit TctC
MSVKLGRREFVASSFAVLGSSLPAFSQAYPSKQITIVLALGAGSGMDIVTRLYAEKLTAVLGKPVIVENRPGAATIPGTSAVLQAPADGYTLLEAGTNTNINPILGNKTPYDAEKDLVPVALLVTVPAVLVVNAAVPANNVAELIAFAKAKPGELNYGSAGNGTFAHLAMEQFTQATGTKITHVPFKGLAPSMLGLLRNDVQVMASDIPGSLEHIRAGKLRALAHTGATRMPQLPDLPTLAEAGVKDYEAAGFLGIMVRTGTPPEAIAALNREINTALKSPELMRHITNNGLGTGGGTPADFIAFLNRDRAIWTRVIGAGGIKAE